MMISLSAIALLVCWPALTSGTFLIQNRMRSCFDTCDNHLPRGAIQSGHDDVEDDADNIDVPPTSNRRKLIENVARGVAISSMMGLQGVNAPMAMADSVDIPSSAQILVVTGANSGIGFEACKGLAAQGHTIVLACRTLAKAQETADRLQELRGNLIPAECNLASLKSIQSFSNQLPELIGKRKIDVLCLNAGVSRNTAATDVARTEDGFELTVGTNHFGHFYLNSLLLPSINPIGGRIVVTASSVHDPESPGGAQGVPATLGKLAGLEQQGRDCEMIDGGSFNADKAYKDSKLCNVLFTRELQKRLDASDSTKGIIANCFTPGLIVGTGLFRDQNPFFVKLFDLAATDLLKVGESPSWGGGCLTYMTTVTTKGLYYASAPGSSKYGDDAYGKQFTVAQVSKEGQDDTKASRFWELSEKALGIQI